MTESEMRDIRSSLGDLSCLAADLRPDISAVTCTHGGRPADLNVEDLMAIITAARKVKGDLANASRHVKPIPESGNVQ